MNLPENFELKREKNDYLVPVRTICELIDIDFQTQDNWLKKHKIYAQSYRLAYTTGADGKSYQMSCIGLFDAFSWLMGISNNNRKEGSFEKQMQLSSFLRNQFIRLYKSIELLQEENEREIQLRNKIEDTEELILKLSSELKEAKKERITYEKSLEDLRVNKYTGQTELSFE